MDQGDAGLLEVYGSSAGILSRPSSHPGVVSVDPMSSDPTIPNGKTVRPTLSDEERARRRKAVETARASNQLSGFEPDPEAEALNARYIAGELTSDELTAAILALAGLSVPDR